MKNQMSSPLLPFGAGVAAGGLALWALIKLWPLIIIGGGLALALKGLEDNEENDEEPKE